MAGKVEEGRIPAYLGIYNRLYTDIISGLYDEARILPGENVLAQK